MSVSRLGTGVADTVKRNAHVHRAARKMRRSVGRLVPPRRLPGIPGRVHFNDFMFTTVTTADAESYRERALNVIASIEETLAAAGKTFDDIQRWLDFGCGYGRVIRFLVERVPAERVFAGDVVREGVDFCRSEFDVHPVYSATELASVRLDRFDFIYAVSVLTHLNERNSVAFLRLLGKSLDPGGIVLFTVHGRYSLENPALYGGEYEAMSEEIESCVAGRGLAFVPYPYERGDDYGMAWHSREWVEETMRELHDARVRLLRFEPRGLDAHQDLFAFQRVS